MSYVNTKADRFDRVIKNSARGAAPLTRASSPASNDIDLLSRRENEVLNGIAFGLTNRQIAEWLSISSRTVEIHRMHAIQKLGARNSADAVRIALTSGFRCEHPPLIDTLM